MALLHQLCYPIRTPSISTHQNPSPSSSFPFSKSHFSSTLFLHTKISKTPSPLKPLTHFYYTSLAATQNIQSQQTQQDAEEEAAGGSRLIAQNVPWDSSADDIRNLFQNHGTVLDVELSMYNKTRNRGLAFVTMGSPEEAQAALNNLESYEFNGRILKVNYARSEKKKQATPTPPKPVSPYNLFVANLPYEARAKDLREFFGTGIGKVVSAEIIFHENPRRSAGYGFVSFCTKDDAEGALSAFQGKMFMGRPIRLALSKRFLKQGTEGKNQSGDIPPQVNQDNDAKQSDETEES